MRAEEIKGLMEAYSHVYETPEVLSEEVVEEDVEVLDEAPMTAFQAGGGQAKLDQLNKGRSPRAGKVTAAQIERQGQQNLYKAGGGDAAIAKGPTRTQNVRGGGQTKVPTLTRQDIINRGTVAAGSKPKPAAPATPAKPATSAGPAKPSAPSAPAAAKPAPTPATKPAPAATAKPSTPAAPAKPAPGTKAAGPESIKPKTPNPLMKDMPGATLKKAQEAPKPQMSARAQALKSGGPAGSARERMLNQGVDIFDLVKGHLLDEGYAETEENAVAMMANMSEEWRETILEAILDESSYSAKAARAGKDIGKPGKMFGKIAKEAGERYGSEERGKKVAGAVLAKLRKEENENGSIELEDILALNRKMERVYEAQAARENPEKHEEESEKEDEKKYGKVRGEKTPMPPRGDKRREAFEKWYAKQMGR